MLAVRLFTHADALASRRGQDQQLLVSKVIVENNSGRLQHLVGLSVSSSGSPGPVPTTKNSGIIAGIIIFSDSRVGARALSEL